MPTDADRTRLRHMRDAAGEAISFAQDRSFTDLERDRQFQLALVRCIEIIGEAASRVSDEYRATHPDVPWARIIGTRHRLIHAYFDVNLGIVWRTVKEELPNLVALLDSTQE